MSEQLSLFAEHNDAIATAITKISKPNDAPPSYGSFVRSLGGLMTAVPHGSFILAAVPSACATQQVCASLNGLFAEARTRTGNGQFGRIAQVEIPHSPSNRSHDRRIVDAYFQFSVSSFARHHQLGFALTSNAPEPLRQVSTLISGQPVDYFLLSHGHHLAPAGGDFNQSIERVRFFIELARHSGKTHVCFVSPTIACQWLESSVIAQEVHTCWLRPYAMKDEKSRIEFKGILKGYDKALPRAAGFDLLSHAKQVFEVVWGCPYRLNKWVRTTLAHALANGASEVNWSDFIACAPNTREQAHSRAEFTSIMEMTEVPAALYDQTIPLPDAEAAAQATCARKKRLKPGQRRLGRDAARQTAA